MVFLLGVIVTSSWNEFFNLFLDGCSGEFKSVSDDVPMFDFGLSNIVSCLSNMILAAYLTWTICTTGCWLSLIVFVDPSKVHNSAVKV